MAGRGWAIRMHQNGAVATEVTHEHAKLKNHVVAHGLMRRASCLDNVFELRDGDGEMQILDGLLQDFERVTARPEDALSPTPLEALHAADRWQFRWPRPVLRLKK